MSTKLVSHMFSRLVWVGGFLFMGLGFVAQATALHFGTLSVVQPLLVSELLITVVVLWTWYGEALRARDAMASVTATAGLGLFLALAAPTESSFSPSRGLWILVAGVCALSALMFVGLGLRGPSWWRALSLGTGASIGFALTAALTKPVTDAFAAGVGPLLTSWATYAMALGGLFSFFVMQSAFSAGPFAASQTTLILVNPCVSVVLGVVLFHESLHHEPARVIGEVVAIVATVIGAVAVTTSPLVAGAHGDSHHLTGRGRYARWRERRRST